MLIVVYLFVYLLSLSFYIKAWCVIGYIENKKDCTMKDSIFLLKGTYGVKMLLSFLIKLLIGCVATTMLFDCNALRWWEIIADAHSWAMYGVKTNFNFNSNLNWFYIGKID